MLKQIIAHRGESIECPENTIPSFKKAFDVGADGIECDLQITKDDVGVIFHDRSLEKKLGIKSTISELPFSDLRKMDFGRWKSENWKGERIANLDDTLAVVPEGKVIHIELKCGIEGVDVLAKAIEHSDIANSQIVFTGFDVNLCKACKANYPKIPFLLNGFEFDYEQISDSDIDGIATYYNAAIFEQVAARGLLYRMGNINTADEIDQVYKRGVEVMDTDCIEFVVDYTRSRNLI